MCRVLCIEDDAETRVLLKKSLSAAGMTVDTVWGGEKGLEAALAGDFDCVLLDIMMPGMDGFQVFAAMQEQQRTKRIPVVMITGRADEDTRQKALDAGVAAYIYKPFEFKQLIAIVRDLAQGSD
jgi:DNA-binding response OmpR family regulator